MDLPIELVGQSVLKGEIYFFKKGCPKGIEEHMHVCVHHADQVLIFGTCSSQKNTAIRLAKFRKDDPDTYPFFKKSPTNCFTEDITYVDCNQVFSVTEEEFAEWRKEKKVKLNKGVFNEEELGRLIHGIMISNRVPGEIQDMFK